MSNIVLVCGGRNYDNTHQMFAFLDHYHDLNPIDVVVEGDARGADSMAGIWAHSRGVHVAKVPAIWRRRPQDAGFDGGAGPKRNRAMLLLKPDVVIAFPGGKGTADMIKAARAAKIDVIEVEPEDV